MVGFEVDPRRLLAALDRGDDTSIAVGVEQRHGSFGEVAAFAGLPLVVHVGEHAPTRRMTAASLGKIPTTRERRLISLLTRSSGLVDQILRQCARGKPVNARTSALASSISGPILGNDVASWSRTSSQVALTAAGVGLGEDRAEHGGDHVAVRLRDVGEQVAGEVDPAPLMPGALEAPLERRDQTGVLVADHQPDTGQATPLRR